MCLLACYHGWTACKEGEQGGEVGRVERKGKLKKSKENEKRQLRCFSTVRRDASVTLQQGTSVGEMKINSAYSPNEVNSRVG